MGNLLGHTRSAVIHVVSVAATVEEVCFEVGSSFYFREKIIEQYFVILPLYIALSISTVNLDFAKSYETLSEMAVSRVSQNKCGLSNLSDYSAGLKISGCHFCVANPVKKELSNCCSHCRLVHGNNVSDSRSRATWQVSHLSRDNLSFIPHYFDFIAR